MAKFYVGQRVRVKYALTTQGKVCIHKEAIVKSELDMTGYHDLEVIGAPHPKAGYWLARPDQLEPATDSYDVVSWESCAWMPDHLREVA